MQYKYQQISTSKLKAIRKLHLKKYRYQTQTFICEGYRLFTAAINANARNIIEVILSSAEFENPQNDLIVSLCKKYNIPVFSCSEKEFQSISDEKTPSGILFVSKLQTLNHNNLDQVSSKNCIYLENIADPGNLGTIIRTAAWYGIRDIFLSPGSVDPFNMKVVRATAGGIFFVNIFNNIEAVSIKNLALANKYKTISTVVDGGTSINEWKVSAKNIIFFGSEASGLTQSTQSLIDQSVTIPGSGQMESLNLSITAGIILNHISS